MIRVPVDDEDVRDVSLLLRSHAPLLFIAEEEGARVHSLLTLAAESTGLPLYEWRAHRGLSKMGTEASAVYKTESPSAALAHLAAANAEAIFYLRDFARSLEEPEVASRLVELHDLFHEHRGAIVLSGTPGDLPERLASLFTCLRLRTPNPLAYHAYLSQVLGELRKTQPVSVHLTSGEVSELIEQLRGMPFFEVRKLLTQAIVDDGRLDASDLKLVRQHKKSVIERSGLLEFIPAEAGSSPIAGVARLKGWLEKRRVAFTAPAQAKSLGLPMPRGLLLVGVQGCGKSLSARATSSIFQLPLLRLDPAMLFRKYFGESEQNFKKALAIAEDVSPCILWIDEIEKAFSGSGEQDGGTSRRILGSFLTWLAEKEELVFVIATANDISGLPPELLRKGRFDEIFFVDLPSLDVRRDIFALHLAQRRQDPEVFDLECLAEATSGFSGAEIEQVVLSGLYAALTDSSALTTSHLLAEVAATQPLSVTMSEKVEELREWARARTVAVD